MGLPQLLKQVAWLVGSNGTTAAFVRITPCWDWMSRNAPPFWPGGNGSLALVVVLGLISGTVAPTGKTPRKLLLFVIGSVVLGAILMALYNPVLLRKFTVVAPIKEGKREVIGFGLYEWALTPDSVEAIKAHNDDPNRRKIRTPYDLVHARAAWGRPEVISGVLWQSWAVDGASSLLMFLFGLSVFVWTFAVGQFCRFLATPLGLELFPNKK